MTIKKQRTLILFIFVSGTGEVVTCSEEQNSDLFHAILGGLGQFGIITQARIALEPAPKKVTKFSLTYKLTAGKITLYNPQNVISQVKWIRALYSDFAVFSKDQEHLISSENSFNYIEGFVIINRTGLLNNWRTSFSSKDPVQANQFTSEGRVLFCLEVAKYFNLEDSDHIDKVSHFTSLCPNQFGKTVILNF